MNKFIPSKYFIIIFILLANTSTSTALGNTTALEELKFYEEVLILNDRDANAWNGKGCILANLNKYEEAEKAFDKAITIDPKHADALYNKFVISYKLKRYEEALQAYNKVIRINPENRNALYIKGAILMEFKRYKEALGAYEKAISLNPKDDDAYFYKGLALYNLKKYGDALTAYDDAIRLKPKNDAWINKGIVFTELGKYEEALESYEKAIELNLADDIAWYDKGNSLVRLERHEESLIAYDKAIELNPRNINAWIGKGGALFRLEKNEDAVKVFKKVIHMNPNEVNAYTYLGGFFVYIGDLKDASKNISIALHKDRKNVYALYLRGIIEIEKKKYDSASRYFKKAIHLDNKGNSRLLLWEAYANFLDLEFSSKLDTLAKKYQEEVSSIIRKLEKANNVAANDKKEVKAYILYFLAAFYLKSKDIFTAKQKLEECISLEPELKIKVLARELLSSVWNDQIRPSWWRWWINSPSPLYKNYKIAVFSFLIVSIFVSLPLYPFIRHWIPLTLYIFFIVLLIIFLFSPNLERFKAKDFQIELRAPPPFPIDSVLSPIAMEEQLKTIEVKYLK